MLLMKVVLLIQHSNKKIGVRKIKLYLATKIDFKIQKCPLAALHQVVVLQDMYKQILS